MAKENTIIRPKAITLPLMLEFNGVPVILIVLLPNGKFLLFMLLVFINEREKKTRIRLDQAMKLKLLRSNLVAF